MCATGMASARGQVPVVVDGRHVGEEVLHLAAACLGIQAREACTEVFAREFAALEHAERLWPGLRNRRRGVTVGVASQHGPWIELAREPQVHAREHDRGEQVRVGVGAGNAVFDSAAGGRAVWHAERDAAIVHGPARIEWHVRFGLETTVGIRSWGADRERVRLVLAELSERFDLMDSLEP